MAYRPCGIWCRARPGRRPRLGKPGTGAPRLGAIMRRWRSAASAIREPEGKGDERERLPKEPLVVGFL